MRGCSRPPAGWPRCHPGPRGPLCVCVGALVHTSRQGKSKKNELRGLVSHDARENKESLCARRPAPTARARPTDRSIDRSCMSPRPAHSTPNAPARTLDRRDHRGAIVDAHSPVAGACVRRRAAVGRVLPVRPPPPPPALSTTPCGMRQQAGMGQRTGADWQFGRACLGWMGVG